MSAIAISANVTGAGTMTIAAPNTASNFTLTLPAATGTIATTSNFVQIQPISASVATSALTISASALALDFRNTTLGSGTVTTVSGTPASLVVPSTATLGTVSAVQSRLVVIALNNTGTIELAVVNISGGSVLDETTLITTTAISAAASSNTAYYSTTARTSLAFRVIGYIESTQATAGTWATAPSTIQGQGGQALAAMSSLGYGQKWTDVSASRTSGTTYYNTTGKPISILLAVGSGGSTSASLTVNGVIAGYTQGTNMNPSTNAIIPPGAAYVATLTGGTNYWTELR